MKMLVYMVGIIISLIIINTSCQKRSEFSQDEQHPQSFSPTENQIKICHKTGNSYNVIEIDESAWSGHEGHGDLLYEEFPVVGVYRWVMSFTDNEQLHSMYITEVTETTFSGYGKNHADGREWDIADGTIYNDDSFSFTIDYRNSGDYLDCTGEYVCGEGMLGTMGGSESGSWSGFYNGAFSEEWEAIEVDP